MNVKKNNQREVVITEIVAWTLVAVIIYTLARMTF